MSVPVSDLRPFYDNDDDEEEEFEEYENEDEEAINAVIDYNGSGDSDCTDPRFDQCDVDDVFDYIEDTIRFYRKKNNEQFAGYEHGKHIMTTIFHQLDELAHSVEQIAEKTGEDMPLFVEIWNM